MTIRTEEKIWATVVCLALIAMFSAVLLESAHACLIDARLAGVALGIYITGVLSLIIRIWRD